MTDSARQRSFGVVVAGVRLLLPRGELLEYVADAAVYPLPRAGPQVAGLMQLRGHPVVVLDGRSRPMESIASVRRLQVIVIGAVPEAGALIVDAPPVEVVEGRMITEAQAPACEFSAALSGATSDGSEPGQAWWRVEPRRLFEVLAEG